MVPEPFGALVEFGAPVAAGVAQGGDVVGVVGDGVQRDVHDAFPDLWVGERLGDP